MQWVCFRLIKCECCSAGVYNIHVCSMYMHILGLVMRLSIFLVAIHSCILGTQGDNLQLTTVTSLQASSSMYMYVQCTIISSIH